MTREERVEYEQDNLGNRRAKIDELRAQEGMDASSESGLLELVSGDTNSELILYNLPQHADRAYIDQINARNSATSGGVFTLKSATLDNSGNISTTTRRSVDYSVDSGSNFKEGYGGAAFEEAVAVESEFEGQIGVSVVVEHQESTEPTNSI